MNLIADFIKALSPKEEEQAILFYGSEYHVWLGGRYLGIANWTKDEDIGDSFQVRIIDEEGRPMRQVYIVDAWALVIKSNY